MQPNRGTSSGVECAKYVLLIFTLIIGPAAVHQVWSAPRMYAS
jgi:hypothetical protein